MSVRIRPSGSRTPKARREAGLRVAQSFANCPISIIARCLREHSRNATSRAREVRTNLESGVDMRLVALPATLVAAFFVGSGPGSVTPRTVVRTKVTPIDAHGDLRAGLRVSREAHGSCEPGSASLPNNVYRCFSGNFVVDPCWRDWLAVVPTVICLEEPWAETVVRLRLSAPPKPASGRSDLGTEPSGITLRSG